MRCEKCGRKIDNLLVDFFNYDGSDSDYEIPLNEQVNAVFVDVNENWTGYELSKDEQRNTICCPYCKQFPFKSNEIQVKPIVRVVCFKQNKRSPKNK